MKLKKEARHWSQLQSNLKCMVISEFIDVEKSEAIVGLVWLELSWDEVFAIDWNKVGSAVNSVDVYDADGATVPMIELWADHPHPGVFIWLFTNTIKPADNGTWVICPLEGK